MSEQRRGKPRCSILSLPSSARFSTKSQSMFFELASISLWTGTVRGRGGEARDVGETGSMNIN